MATAVLDIPTTQSTAKSTRTIKVEIKRQASPDAKATTQKFEIPYRQLRDVD
jgi:hypothetical protein